MWYVVDGDVIERNARGDNASEVVDAIAEVVHLTWAETKAGQVNPHCKRRRM